MSSARLQVTETGGRAATTRHIPPKLALAVGMPSTAAPAGWQWSPLTELARLESGHTPSRRHPEYWGGSIPWLSIQDAKANHGGYVRETIEQTNDLGIANSSARVLPQNTVCLSRTASVGYVVVMDRPMATSQDFVSWVCSKRLDPNFLKYLLIAEGDDILRFASGAVHQTIYFPEAKAFHICYPPLPEQLNIVRILDEAADGIATAKANAEKNLQNAHALFERHLQAIFTPRAGDWEEKPLAELCDIQHGFAFDGAEFSSDVPEDNPIVVTPGNFTEDGRLLFNKKNTKRLSSKPPAAFLFDVGDLILVMTDLSSKMKILGKPAFVEADCLLHNQRIGRVVFFNSSIEKRFVYYFMLSPLFLRNIKGSATGTMVKHTAPKRILSNVIPFPAERNEQLAVIARLDCLRDKTQRLATIYQRKIAALGKLKQSFLHQAFSGQL